MIPKIVNVKYTFTDDIETAKNWIEFLKTKEVLACDFEAAIRYTKEDIEELEKIANKEVTNAIEYISARQAQGYLKATALDHPTHVQITHFSVAWTESDSYVFIIANDEIRDLVLDFLVTTEIKQIWHNASFDFKLVYYVTGKMPKHFEDTEIYSKCIFNHTETEKCKTGLKALAGAVYGDWAVAEETFCISNMYNENFLHYAAVDSCATMFVYNRLVESFEEEGVVYPTTLDEYTPWSQLPAPSPVGAEYPEAHFYHHTAKWLVRDTVRLMMNGLPIDLTKVQALEQRLTAILEDVSDRLSANPAVNKLLVLQQKEAKELYADIQRSKRKGFGDFLVPFNSKNAIHRSAYMEVFADRMKLPKPKDKLPGGISKWSMALIRKLSSTYPPLKVLIDHSVNPDSPTAVQAMELLAVNKVTAHNNKIEAKIKEREIELKPFNPNSFTHVRDFFSTVGITSEKFSDKTGEPSWDRAQIERVNKTAIDEDVISFTQAMIDNSFAAIVKNNFVNAFYNYTIDGKLMGNYRLIGAKSGRYTSSKPNMLNTPSTRSIFAAPVKECFIAPKGFVVAAIDFEALEDKVVANLSGDINKIRVFTDNIDSHSMASVFYFPDEVKELIGDISDSSKAAVKLKELVDSGCKKAKGIRDRSKPVSLTYKRLHVVIHVE